MLTTVGRELKQNAKDQLRGMRHLIRLLGSDAERDGLARRQALPEAPAEIGRLVGHAFRAVDGVMTAVESAVRPQRPTPGFRTLTTYLGEDGEPAGNGRAAFVDDLYDVLKIVAAQEWENALILETRLADIHADLLSRHQIANGFHAEPDPGEICATLFLSLARHRPFGGPHEPEEEMALRHYAAMTLLFGLVSMGDLPRNEVPSLVPDALLMSGARLDLLAAAVRGEIQIDDLARVFRNLLSHLA